MSTTTASAWHRVLNDLQLRDLPYKVETNDHGQIVYAPPRIPSNAYRGPPARALYLSEGAEEVWTCAPDGTMTFSDASGRREASALVPSFPPQVD